jgi:hypothetical protein
MILSFACGGLVAAAGVYLIHMQNTGVRAQVKVDDCEVSGSGGYRSVHCTSAAVVGGSLFDGGHVVILTVDGAETEDVGKTVDVAIHGDTAYLRDLKLPLILIVAGGGFAAVGVLAYVVARRRASEQEQEEATSA